MKKRVFYQIVIIMGFLAIASQFGDAIGISPPRIERVFTPNFEENITVTISNAKEDDINVRVGVEGEDANYITVSEQEFLLKGGQSKQVLLRAKLPPALKPGMHTWSIFAQELPLKKETGVVAFPVIKGELRMRVPYPGKYMEIQASVDNKNVGEVVSVFVTAMNRGENTIGSVRIEAEVTDEQGKVREKLQTTKRNLGPEKKEEITFSLNPEKYETGIYQVRVKGWYDGIETEEVKQSFQVGHLFVDIVNITSQFKKDAVERVVVDMESKWNKNLDGVYAEMVVKKGGEEVRGAIKSPPIHLDPWETKSVSFFWDTSGLETGAYVAQVTLYYESETTIEEFPILIVEEKQPLNSTIMMIIVIIFILVLDAMWLRGVRKKKKEQDEESGYNLGV